MPKNEKEEIEKLKYELEASKITIKNQELKIKELENMLKIANEQHEEKMKILQEAHLNEKKKLEEKLKKHQEKFEEERKMIDGNNLSQLYKMEEIMSINFTSSDQKINFSLACVENSIFAEIEEKLYKEYPEYRETNNYFLHEGKAILRFKTLKENKIRPGFPIILIQDS